MRSTTANPLDNDPEIENERNPGRRGDLEDGRTNARERALPLQVRNRTHIASAETAALLRAAGGLQMLQKMTGKFYEMAFQDPHLDKFIRSHDDPHGERFANGLLKSLEKAHRGLAIGRQGRVNIPLMATPSTQRRIGRRPLCNSIR